MNKVVLIQPPVQDFYLTRKRTMPYGLASVAAALEADGFPCTIIDGLATDKVKPLPLPGAFGYLSDIYGREDISLFSLFSAFRRFGYTHDHLAALTKKEAPFMVGISSLFTPYADQALATARAVKKFCPGVWVVMGGHHPTAFPESCLASPDVDFVIRGEGENALVRLCHFLSDPENSLEGKSSFSDTDADRMSCLPGIAFRGQAGPVIQELSWEKTLDLLPLPAAEKINHKFYRRGKRDSVTVVASRGCPFGCTYCSVSARSDHGKFRRRSVTRILAEIRSRAETGDVGFIDFEDENLTLNRDWALSLLSGIREIFGERPVELRAMNGLFPPSLDRELIIAMKAAGFKTLNLSVGSFSKPQLDRFGRPDVREAHEAVLSIARELSMETVSYIIGAAPDQRPEETLADLLTLAGQPTLAGLSVFYPAPASLEFERCRRLDILPEQLELFRSSALPLDHATSRIQAATLLRLARIVNFLKQWMDTQGGLPSPCAFSPRAARQLKTEWQGGTRDRFDISTRLVQWFLSDGLIRGMDPDGGVYVHRVDEALSKAFLAGISAMAVMGVKTGPYRFSG